MALSFRIQRAPDAATLHVNGAAAGCAAQDLFDQTVRLIDQGYDVEVNLRHVDFVGLGAVRALKTAALRARKAGVELSVVSGPAVYRIADLVGAERWSPLPRVAFEDDSIAV